jgi:hypothetical protein
MLTLRQLIMATPRSVSLRIRGCRVKVITAFEASDVNGDYKEVDLNINCSGTTRLVRYKFYSASTVSTHTIPPTPTGVNPAYGGGTGPAALTTYLERPVWVHCDCPYFTYYLEVALAARKSSTVMDSNGNYPRIRNPKFKPYLCKHAYMAARPAAAAQTQLQTQAAAKVRRYQRKFVGENTHRLPKDIRNLISPIPRR